MRKFIIILVLLVLSNSLNIGLGRGSSRKPSKEEIINSYTESVIEEVIDEDDNSYVSILVDRAFKKKNGLFNDSVILKMEEVAHRHSFKPSWLIAVIMMESRADPQAVNKYSGATGIIQFLPSTAKVLGTSTEELLGMNIYQQLDYVDKYFYAVGKDSLINSFEDLYLAVFWPKALGKSSDYVISHKGSLASKQNPAISGENESEITVEKFKRYTNNKL